MLGLFEVAKQAGDFRALLWAQLLTLAAQALAHLLPETGGIDQMHLALALRRFAVAEDPDVGADAGVIEHIGRQADDRLHQIVFLHITADLAFARSRTAGEQGRAIQRDAKAAAAL